MSNAQSAASEMFRRMAWWPSIYGRRLHAQEKCSEVKPQPVPLPGRLGELRAAVVADPENDGPRLAYADECERLGDGDRARLICDAIHRGIEEPGCLDELEAWSVREPIWRRGFVEAVTVSGRCFISLGEGLLDAAPIRDVRLIAAGPYLEELSRCAHLARLRGLDLSHSGVDGPTLRPFLGSPNTTGLRSLNLAVNCLGDPGVAELVASPLCARLTELDVSQNGITKPVSSSGLTSLNLSGNLIRDAAKNLRGSGLKHLSLARCGLDSANLPEFDAMPLETLDLRFNPLGDAIPEVNRHLRSLDLGFTGIRNLTGLSPLDALEVLGLAGNGLTDAMFDDIDIPPLREIDLGTNRLTRIPGPLSRCLSLRVSNNFLADAGTLTLLNSLKPPILERLDLSWNDISDTAIERLADCPHLTELRHLDLSGNPIGWRAATALARSPCLTNLRSLIINDCPRLRPDAVALLRERFEGVAEGAKS